MGAGDNQEIKISISTHGKISEETVWIFLRESHN